MGESNRRPSIIEKRTNIRQQKHTAITYPSLPTPPRSLDRLIIGLGYASIAGYIYHNIRRVSPYSLLSVGIGSLTFGLGLYGLGKRSGIIQGADFALRNNGEKEERNIDPESEDWKGEFQGLEFGTLSVVEKISWLRKEEERIREVQEAEQLRCGQAYIAKEEAYVEYEKRGNYGGEAWRRYVDADSVCQDMYNKYEKQQRRLSEIRKEINALNEQI